MDKVNHAFVIDVACPFDPRIVKKEGEEVDVWNPHKYEAVKKGKGLDSTDCYWGVGNTDKIY